MINSQCYEEQFNPSAVKLPQCECVYKMYIKVWIYGTAQHYGKQADPSIFSESECCFSAHFCYFMQHLSLSLPYFSSSFGFTTCNFGNYFGSLSSVPFSSPAGGCFFPSEKSSKKPAVCDLPSINRRELATSW